MANLNKKQNKIGLPIYSPLDTRPIKSTIGFS